MAAETVVIDIVANFRNQTSAGMESARTSADRFGESVRRARREAERLGGTNARPRVTLVDRASSALSGINKKINSFAGKTVRAGVKVVDYATRPLRAIKNTLFSIKGLVVAIGAGWAANKLFSEPIGLADAYSSAKIGFSNLLGESGAQNMMDKLDEFAKKTPFKTSGVIDNAQKMMAMGWNTDTLIKDMETIGDAAAATGKMDQGLESIVRALAQIKTKGKLSTEELNQLSEAGIAAKAMLAEQLGYGTGDKGIAKMTKDLEDGLIGSDTAIQALLKGMEQFDGTMEKTANETVEGLKSQIQDAFEINILRRWGQGLQDGAKRGIGSIVDLLDKSGYSLEKIGDTVYDIGKQLSNWAADKLDETIDKIMNITQRRDFKSASLGGKIKILWDEVIAQPFGDWWESKGKDYISEKLNTIGEGLGSGLSKSLLALLGVDISGATDSAATLGGSFASGFAKGFEGKKVWEALVKAAGRAFKTGFSVLFSGSWLTNIIVAKLGLQLTSGILKGINLAQTFWSGTGATTEAGTLTLAGRGLSGTLGSASAGTGILGWGANTAMTLGAGNLASGASVSAGALSAMGLGATAGIIGGVAGLGNSVVDLTRTIKADTKNDKKLYGTRAATKFGMVGTGAAIGATIGSVVPVLGTGVGAAIGAGLGGIATFVAGNKLADAISGVSKSTEELNEEAEKLAAKRMDKRFGEIELSAEELSKRVKKIFGADTIQKVNKFNTAFSNLETTKTSTNSYRDDINYTHARIMAKEKLSKNDVTDYQMALSGYADSVSQLLSSNKSASRSAFQLLYGDDTKGLQKATKNMNSTYTKLENTLAKKSAKLNKVIAKAFEDGKITINEEKKINELVNQIIKIQNEVERRVQEAESKANYDLIKMKYSDSELTTGSFKKLMSELNAQSETDLKAYDDAYKTAKMEYDLELKTNPKYTKEQYEKDVAAIEEKWREGKAITVKKGVEISLDVITKNYSDEFKQYEKWQEFIGKNGLGQVETLKQSTEKYNWKSGTTTISWGKEGTKVLKGMKDEILKNAGIDSATQKEMKSMYESLKPQEQDLLDLKKSYEDAGKKIPQWITDSLAEIDQIKLFSGDTNSFYKLMGEQIASQDKEYAKSLLENAGAELPKYFKEGLEKGLKGEVKTVEVEPVEVNTNLKLKANKKDIDTSNLDKTTKDVVEKMKDKGVIYTKEGKVKIKTKDGAIDTSNLDKETKKAIKKLQEDGVIKINKDGTVTIKAKVNTEKAKEKTESKTKSELGKSTKVKKTAKVNVDSKTTGTDTAAKKSKAETEAALNAEFAIGMAETGAVAITLTSTGLSSSVSTLFSTVTQALKDKFSTSIPVTAHTVVSTVRGSSAGNAGGSSKKKKKKKANGGYVDKPIVSLVGEAGPEMIIPLSAERRQRGKSLWEQAGRAMGLYQNANGGLYGHRASAIGNMLNSGTSSVNGTETPQRTSGNGTVKVDVGGIHITIQSSGNGVQEDISQNADTITAQIAVMVEKAFQNMPITVGT